MARLILGPSERVSHCHRTPFAAQVGVLQVPGRDLGSFSGLQTCGSVWHCPVCASKISERRRVELGEGIASWESAGGRVVMMTYTARHHHADQVGKVLAGVQRARQRMCRQRRYREYMKSCGVVGKVYTLEVTHGANGWHPHIHELLFLEPGAAIGVAFLEFFLLEAWLDALAREEMPAGNQHAVKGQDMKAAQDYITKFGRSTWTPAHEITKQPVKSGRVGSQTPLDLLEAFGEGDLEAGNRWREYAEAFKGRRQLVWSKGLRETLGLDGELTDEELAAEVEDEGVLLLTLNLREWAAIVANDCRAEVLELAGRGDAEGIRALVKRLTE